jgi:predicted ATPase
MRPAKLPGAKGEDLVSCLYDLRESDRDRFDMVESIISAAFPDFERLNFPPVAAGTISMTWKDRNFSQPIEPIWYLRKRRKRSQIWDIAAA